MTANTLYEALEPHILWRQLLMPVFGEITADSAQSEVSMQPRRLSYAS
jgi:hypothetical protein